MMARQEAASKVHMLLDNLYRLERRKQRRVDHEMRLGPWGIFVSQDGLPGRKREVIDIGATSLDAAAMLYSVGAYKLYLQ
jgi:hypothetical protein